MIKVFDNFLSKEHFDIIKKEITSIRFPWYYEEGRVTGDDRLPSLTHSFFEENVIHSNWYQCIIPVIHKCEMKALRRIKANFDYKNHKAFKTIYRIWKLYHLNDMQAGSPQQTAYLNTLTRPEGADCYTWECSKLAEVDLYIDNSYLVDGKPYKYGTRWLKSELPMEVIKEIRDL